MDLAWRHFTWLWFHGIPWNIPWNSMELCLCQIGCHRFWWNCMELWDYHCNWHQVPLDFLWIFHGTLGLPKRMSPSLMDFQGTSTTPFQMTLVPLNSMEYSMEFHGNQPLPNGTPPSSMEFHGTRCPPNEMSPSSTEFHGIRRAPFQMTPGFHGIPWNSPWNFMNSAGAKSNCTWYMDFHGTLRFSI